MQLILATFDIFDTEPRTWQLDFDEFCHWLETGERVLNSHGISKPTPAKNPATEPAKGKILSIGTTITVDTLFLFYSPHLSVRRKRH